MAGALEDPAPAESAAHPRGVARQRPSGAARSPRRGPHLTSAAAGAARRQRASSSRLKGGMAAAAQSELPLEVARL